MGVESATDVVIEAFDGRLYAQAKQEEETREEAISEIGIVWHIAVLDEIVSGGVPGTKLSELPTIGLML